jgi:hypothetical protein
LPGFAPSVPIGRRHVFTVWLYLHIRHALRVVVVTFFTLAFVAFFTRVGTDWFHATLGALVGLFFGVLFVFGGRWADLEERSR